MLGVLVLTLVLCVCRLCIRQKKAAAMRQRSNSIHPIKSVVAANDDVDNNNNNNNTPAHGTAGNAIVVNEQPPRYNPATAVPPPPHYDNMVTDSPAGPSLYDRVVATPPPSPSPPRRGVLYDLAGAQGGVQGGV